MKEKIFAALKTACGNNTSISDKTLEKIAETLAVTIKEESQIEAAVEIQKPILQAIDGNINHVTAEAVKKVKPEKPIDIEDSKKGPGRPKKDADPDEPAWFTAYKEEQKKTSDEIKAEIEKQKQEKTSAALADKVSKHEKLKDIPASYLKGRNLVPKSEAEIDQLVTSIVTDYAGFKQEMAEKGVVISVPPAGGGTQGEKVSKEVLDYINEKMPLPEKSEILTKN